MAHSPFINQSFSKCLPRTCPFCPPGERHVKSPFPREVQEACCLGRKSWVRGPRSRNVMAELTGWPQPTAGERQEPGLERTSLHNLFSLFLVIISCLLVCWFLYLFSFWFYLIFSGYFTIFPVTLFPCARCPFIKISPYEPWGVKMCPAGTPTDNLIKTWACQECQKKNRQMEQSPRERQGGRSQDLPLIRCGTRMQGEDEPFVRCQRI